MLDKTTRDLYFGGDVVDIANRMSLEQLSALNEAYRSGELTEDEALYKEEQIALNVRRDRITLGHVL